MLFPLSSFRRLLLFLRALYRTLLHQKHVGHITSISYAQPFTVKEVVHFICMQKTPNYPKGNALELDQPHCMFRNQRPCK